MAATGAAGRIDLLSVLTHELDHMLGSVHLSHAEDGDLMGDTLSTGPRLSFFADGEDAPTGGTLIYDDTTGGFVTDEGLRHMTSARTLRLDLDAGTVAVPDADVSDAPFLLTDPIPGTASPDVPRVSDTLVVWTAPAETAPQDGETASGNGKAASDTGKKAGADVTWKARSGLLDRLSGLFH